MKLPLSDADRSALRHLQAHCRARADYVPVTVVLLLDKGRSVPSIADDLGVSVATVYRHAGAWQAQGPAAFRQADPPAGATGDCSPAPNSPAFVRNWAATATPIAAKSRIGWR